MEKMMMPAYYNVLSTEEMTYTEGGAKASLTETLAVWLWPSYAQVIGISMCREERLAGNSDWMGGAWNRVTEKCGWYAAGMAINNAISLVLSCGAYAITALGVIAF